MPKREPIDVWMWGERVAELTSKKPWQISCTYTPEAVALWPGNAPILSCSLPLSRKKIDASAYLRGLLPEGRHLDALASRGGIATNDTFGLLALYGRDVAGAVVIGTESPTVRPGRTVPYDEASLAAEVDGLQDRPLGLHDDSELSIAGLQNKMLLVRTDEGWARPAAGAPSTHILKLDDLRHPGLVAAEHAALELARVAGLSAARSELLEIGGRMCLVVERFDRVVESGGEVGRIHQEDLCQAVGRDAQAERGRAKYQDAGGPGFADAARLLDQHSLDWNAESRRLVEAMVFTVMVGNADAHGKNLALLHPVPEHVALAPLYDTVPTALWPRLRSSLAMTVNGRSERREVTADDLVAEAASWPMDPDRARAVVGATIESVGNAVDACRHEPLATLVLESEERLGA